MGSYGVAQIRKPWIETPLVESAALSRAAGCRIFLKLENLQPSGSFKIRGLGNLVLSHISNPAYVDQQIHFYALSAGNAGLAAVCAARTLSYPCTVVLPTTTSPAMVQKLHAAGATEVIQHGATIAAAGEYMNEVLMKGRDNEGDEEVVKIALHPFDDEAVWEGNSTIVDELAYQLPADDSGRLYGESALPVDAMVCSVGGGGLLNGLVKGIEKRITKTERLRGRSGQPSWKERDIHILAVEPEGAASLGLALSQKSLATLPKITSLATSLGVARVSAQTLKYSLSPPPGVEIHSVILSDADAAKGVLRLVDDERLLVELACGICVEAAVDTAKGKRGRKRKRCMKDEGYYGDQKDRDEKIDRGENEALVCDEDSSAPPTPDYTEIIEMPRISRLKQLLPDLGRESRVVIIVCGGSNVSIEMTAEWRKRLELGWENDGV